MAFSEPNAETPHPPPPPGRGGGAGPEGPVNDGKPASGSGGSPKDLGLIAAARAQAKGGSGSRSTWAVIPPESIPGYEIIKEIHRGGQGVVYQAIQKTTKRKVAVKVMREGPFAGPRDKARFEREVEILAQMNHPNIVGILDSGQAGGSVSGGSFFFVMDYISGHPLDVWMSMKERTLEDTLKIFARICDAVNAAHLKGVIHRDLKPGNIRVDDSGEPHILDFGLAKVATGEVSGGGESGEQMRMMTMTGQFVGSLPWASPEQAEGHPDKIDVRTDVYSLGVILYQMLTGGKFPYQVIGAMREVLDNILRTAPARPSTVRRQINDEVETIVLKSLAKERERRYQNAGELARDVRNYLSGFPIEAKRDSAVYQLRVIARRNKGKVLAAGIIGALTVGFGIAMAFLYREAENQRVRAETALSGEQRERARAESEKKRAEDNFDFVRGLAKAAINEFDEGIAPLVGSTSTRQKVLVQARAYMEKLAAQAGDDPGLLRETADAADKVGDIEGGLNRAKVGTPGAAAEAYQRARAIRDKLLERSPSDPRAVADVGLSRHKAALLLYEAAKLAQAREELDRALELFDRAVSMLPPGAPAAAPYVERAARARMTLGTVLDAMAGNGDDIEARKRQVAEAAAACDKAADYWRERLRDNPGDESAAAALAECLSTRNGLDSNVAAPLARRARELGSKGDTAAPAMFAQALDLYKASAAGADSMVQEFERLLAAKPQSREFQRALLLALRQSALARKNTAETFMLRSRVSKDPSADAPEIKAQFEAALVIRRRAEDMARSLSSSDAGNVNARRDLAACTAETGNELRDLGRLEEAAAKFDESLEVRRFLYKADPQNRQRQDLALGLFKRGDLDRRIAEASADKGAKAEHLKLAEMSLQEAVALYEKAVADGSTDAQRNLTVVKQTLENVRTALKGVSSVQ